MATTPIKCVTCGGPAAGLDYMPVYLGESGARKSGIQKRPKCRAHAEGKGGLLPFPWDAPPPAAPAPKLLTEAFLDDVMAAYQQAVAAQSAEVPCPECKNISDNESFCRNCNGTGMVPEDWHLQAELMGSFVPVLVNELRRYLRAGAPRASDL